MAKPVDLFDRDKLLQSANTSLNSKVVSQHSSELSPIAVDAVLKVIDTNRESNVNLKDIKVIKKLGGTVDDTELVEGLVFGVEHVLGVVEHHQACRPALAHLRFVGPQSPRS